MITLDVSSPNATVESNLTFNGSTLLVTGTVSTTGGVINNVPASATSTRYGLQTNITGPSFTAKQYGESIVISASGSNNWGSNIEILGAPTQNNYGINVDVTGAATLNNYGLYVNSVNAATNYAIYTVKGLNLFNSTGDSSSDLRVRGSGNTHLFFIDVSTDYIGVRNATPSYALHVLGTVSSTSFAGANNQVVPSNQITQATLLYLSNNF